MRLRKPLPLDLHRDYPCPCRRRGRLVPIILTEAYGCDLCQQIFVLQEASQEIEQISSLYPYKRRWRWTGYRWRLAPTLRPRERLVSVLIPALSVLAGLFWISGVFPWRWILGIMGIALAAAALLYLSWLA
ncbi:MAG: hypothetical protein ACK5CA_02580 [Cyanobacteriota bacterium]